MSTRKVIQEPTTLSDWENLPKEFLKFVDEVDCARNELSLNQKVDPLYPNYDYEWQIDSDLSIQMMIEYWNSNKELPKAEKIVEEINEAMAEAAYDDYVSSFYSY